VNVITLTSSVADDSGRHLAFTSAREHSHQDSLETQFFSEFGLTHRYGSAVNDFKFFFYVLLYGCVHLAIRETNHTM
jgi:hypothetical protein